jgi:flagellar M-ring protein FliF
MAAKTQIAVPKQAGGHTAIDRVKSFWNGRNKQQRVYLAVGLAATVAVAVFFFKMIAGPNYKPLMTGLEPGDAQQIASQLAAKKIPFQISTDRTSINVPSDEVNAARLEVASHDAVHSGRIGFEIFDKVSWGQTEFDEKVNYQRALEGELERTIQTMSNVKSARVHLVMATDSVFIDRERSAKASVTLHLKSGGLSRADATKISRLVAAAVDGLKPAYVVVIDADSNQSLGSNSSDEPNDGLEHQLTQRLISTLAPVVGADRMRATVNVEYETGSSEESQEKYDPAVSVTLNMQRSEEMTGPDSGVGGIPGTSSNVAAAKPTTPPAKPGAPASAPAATPPVTANKELAESSKTESATYGVNKTTRHVISPAGGIRRLTAAVLVDDVVDRKQDKGKWVETRHKRSPDDLKFISELAQAAIGFNSARGDVISVQNLSFDHGPPLVEPPPTMVDKVRRGLNDYSAVFRYAGLVVLFLLVYTLMLRPIQQRALAALPPSEAPAAALAAGAAAPPEVEPDAEALAAMALRTQVLKKQLADFVKAEPESSTNAIRVWLREEA